MPFIAHFRYKVLNFIAFAIFYSYFDTEVVIQCVCACVYIKSKLNKLCFFEELVKHH